MKKKDLTIVEEIIKLLDKYNLTEIWLEEKDVKIGVKRDQGKLVSWGRMNNQEIIPSPHEKKVDTEIEKAKRFEEENLVQICAPMVGTFRQATSPIYPPLIEEGNTVEVNQVVGYIEAMKMLNEVKSGVRGKVIKVLAEEGQPVEFGQTLFLVEPLP